MKFSSKESKHEFIKSLILPPFLSGFLICGLLSLFYLNGDLQDSLCLASVEFLGITIVLYAMVFVIYLIHFNETNDTIIVKEQSLKEMNTTISSVKLLAQDLTISPPVGFSGEFQQSLITSDVIISFVGIPNATYKMPYKEYEKLSPTVHVEYDEIVNLFNTHVYTIKSVESTD